MNYLVALFVLHRLVTYITASAILSKDFWYHKSVVHVQPKNVLVSSFVVICGFNFSDHELVIEINKLRQLKMSFRHQSLEIFRQTFIQIGESQVKVIVRRSKRLAYHLLRTLNHDPTFFEVRAIRHCMRNKFVVLLNCCWSIIFSQFLKAPRNVEGLSHVLYQFFKVDNSFFMPT